MSDMKRKEKELTGRHVLIMLVAFFGVIFAVNAVYITQAVTSFRGEDVKGSYRQGLEYNQTLAERETQKQLGWQVSANFIAENTEADGRLLVKFQDEESQAIDGLTITGSLRHPSDLNADQSVSFQARGEGLYEATLAPQKGTWTVRAEAEKDGDLFRFYHTINWP